MRDKRTRREPETKQNKPRTEKDEGDGAISDPRERAGAGPSAISCPAVDGHGRVEGNGPRYATLRRVGIPPSIPPVNENIAAEPHVAHCAVLCQCHLLDGGVGERHSCQSRARNVATQHPARFLSYRQIPISFRTTRINRIILC